MSILEAEASPSKSVPIWKLFRISSTQERLMNGVGILFAIAAGTGTPFMSLFFGNLINSFVQIGRSRGNHDSLGMVVEGFRAKAAQDALHLTFLGIGLFCSTFIFISIWSYTGESTARKIREHYFRAIIHQDLSFYDNITAGEVATRVEIDAHLVQQGISEKFAFVISYITSFVTGLAIAYTRSWRLALALTAMVPCILLVGAVIAAVGMRYSSRSLEALSQAGGVAQESLSTIRIVHAFGAESKISSLFNRLILMSCHFDKKFSKVVGIGMAVFSFIVYSSYSLSFFFGTKLLIKGLVDAGTVVTVGLSILIGSFSLAIVGPHVEAIVHAQQAAAHLYDVIDRETLIDSASDSGRKIEDVIGEVVFDAVSFGYPSRKDISVLQDISIRFPPQKTTALVGYSGSGKSTIISLVERFYDVSGGAIFLDGVNIRSLNVKWLRSRIGLVSQDPTLFSGSIYDNVALGLIGSPQEDLGYEGKRSLVEKACIKAQAHDFINALPEGYGTLVGDGAMRLSGGQKQRIAIARAIISDPPILLLDEATSALDTHSEGIVQAALAEASQGRTTIVIAHRLSTIKDADVIYVMGNGAVLEYGSHASLMANPHGHYSRLVNAQRLDQEGVELSGYRETEAELKGLFVVAEKPETNDRASAYVTNQDSKGSELGFTKLIWEIGQVIPDTFQMYLWGTFFGCLGGLVHPAFGIVYAKALHSFENSNIQAVRSAGMQNALWLFIIAIISTISLALHNYFYGKAATILVSRLRSLTFEQLLKQEVSFFDKDENNPGTLTANLIGRPEKIKGFASMTLGAILQCTSCCIGGAIVGLIFGWKLSLVGIACMPLIVAMGFARLQLVAYQEKMSRESHNHSAQVATEAVVAIRTVAALTCENHWCDVYSKALHSPLNDMSVATLRSSAAYACSLSVFLFTVALVFWYGSRLVASGEYSTFRFYVTFMSTVFSSWNAANVFMSVPDMTSATDSAREIITFLSCSKKTNHNKVTSTPIPKGLEGRIEFQDVFFRYPQRPEVTILKDFNLSIEPGTYNAFVGPSGSGKSTIIQLLERYYNASNGHIYVDGHPLSQMNIDEYRNNIALVSQDTRLYSGTIRFNILLGSSRAEEDVTEEELRNACRLANILEFIESLPLGFATQVGERGSQLSGGQKQRIAIARAIIRNPRILLLDEATSSLDANSEAAVQKALNDAAVGRTTIAIAHRLSSIQHADCIYFIQEGRIQERGTHAELIERKGLYYRYAQFQHMSG